MSDIRFTEGMHTITISGVEQRELPQDPTTIQEQLCTLVTILDSHPHFDDLSVLELIEAVEAMVSLYVCLLD